MHIENTVCLVTGGCSWLGAATTKLLVASGAKVVIADVNAEAGLALADELGQSARFIRPT